jgi:hypothetical protein
VTLVSTSGSASLGSVPTTSLSGVIASGGAVLSATTDPSIDASLGSGAAPFVSTLQAVTQKPPSNPLRPITTAKVCRRIVGQPTFIRGAAHACAGSGDSCHVFSVLPLALDVRDFSLHVVAWGLLRTCAPVRAHAILLRIGSRLAPIETLEEARRVVRRLSRHGTCLSRSLAVAARTPTADVVIGVEPRENAPLFAHAWVEMDGVPLDHTDVAGAVIARLRGPRSSSPHSRYDDPSTE